MRARPQIDSVISAIADCFNRLNYLFAKTGDAGYQLDRRARLKPAFVSQILIYDAENAASARVRHYDASIIWP